MDIPIRRNQSAFFKRVKPIYCVIAIALVAMTVLSFTIESALPSVENEKVWVGEVKRGEFSHEIRGVGNLVAADNRWISTASAGIVERVLVKPGARVSGDSILIKLRNPELEQDYKQAEWEYNAAEAQFLALKAEIEEKNLEYEMLVAEAKMEVELALMNEKAQKPLAEKNIISAIDFENSKLRARQSQLMLRIRSERQKRRAEVAKARLAAEEAKVWMFRNQVERMRAQVEALEVRAGFDGVVQQIPIELGQQIQVGTSVARVANPQELIAELQVQEVHAEKLSLDLVVIIDTRNELLNGKVIRIDPRVDKGNVQVDVEFNSQLSNSVRPDLSVTGTILVEKIADTLFIDRPAGVSANSESLLYIVDPSTLVARKSLVSFGSASVSQIEILNGLQLGEKVVLSDTTEFRQHNSIQIN
ncbi:efflux RND transporter periplasmic adaptor subunit [Aliikangiella coralliicola]|uniref:HlyD family efflux transporter periplasmic adaptor subunit n=1 Tax=Aliikangiella coralliicola TaxID=2592383 RepID=A0A545UGG3_9GAMM|nr:HlyD family efflux transporter periplasmic adaptor subunit [Aliikangiella coralliicola]TQV88560.1 HlyD family efflux transporter periplasmic adaptor subunit [Aliikangiella coralliicola]